MKIRLDKWISDKTELTRSDAKTALKKGRIKVNQVIEKDPGRKLDTDTDKVYLDGSEIAFQEHTYIFLNKPQGFVTSTGDDDGLNVMSLIKVANVSKLFPVGRLDKDTEGLLLITDDGELSHRLLSPKHHVPKTYYAELEKNISDQDIINLQDGVDIHDDEITKPAIVERVSEKAINLTITEGRYHQVKRMLQAVDNKVIFLKRIAFAGIRLEDTGIETGSFRELDIGEINELKGINTD